MTTQNPNDDNLQGGITLFNKENIQRNYMAVDKCRTAVSLIGGITAGTLGLTGISGFLFFGVTVLMLSISLLLKAGSNRNNYFQESVKMFVMDSFFGSLFLYIVFWTFFYGLVNVY